MLDATKAFDRVEYVQLIKLLMVRDIPPVSLRLLFNMYTCHGTRIAWNGVYSESASVLNGVKQVGFFSPVLFCIYLDGLLCMLAESKIGCFIGNVFVGAVAYADDIAFVGSNYTGYLLFFIYHLIRTQATILSNHTTKQKRKKEMQSIVKPSVTTQRRVQT